MTTLAESYDALLLDLDGTVYLGGEPIEHVASALAIAKEQGARSVFVTNNASRPPVDVAAALSAMGVQAEPDDVLTSPQAAAVMLADRHPAGTKVLVVGAPWLAQSVTDVGLVPVHLATDHAAAVVQGHSPETGWKQLAEACITLRTGADWVACNIDSTLPTDRGLLPGNGAMVAALVAATGLQPRVAGKPARPLLDTAIRLVGAQRPLVVGDRLDTDIAGAVAAEEPSLLVLSGVSTATDLLAAGPAERPTFLAFDLRGLVDESRAVRIPDDQEPAGWSGWSVTVDEKTLILASATSRTTDQESDSAGMDTGVTDTVALQALATLAAAAWKADLSAVRSADPSAAAALTRCGLPEAVATV
ncbi:MAG: HAD-IIA family hydrolase [Nakamurella sp.]